MVSNGLKHYWPYGDSSTTQRKSTSDTICTRHPVNTDFCAASHTSVKCNPTSKGSCAICGTTCRILCVGCRSVNYCSKKHQQLHWSKHKVFCRAFSVPPQFPTPARSSSSSSTGTSPGGTGNQNKAGNSKDSNGGNNANNSSRLELKWMIANKDIPGGKTLFSEKPLLIVPNFNAKNIQNKKSLCFGCYRHFPSTSSHDTLRLCPVCQLPLCKDCLESSSSRHPQNECNAVADAVSKNRPTMASWNERIGQSVDLVRDYTILKVLLLNKACPESFDCFITLKSNVRYTSSLTLKSPPDFLKIWMDSVESSRGNYFISKSYLSSAFKDKSIKLDEVVRIFAIFSDVSWFNPEHRVLYTWRSWIPHSCHPNAEFHFSKSDPSQTLHVKTVDHIKADGLISVNYIADYEEGSSKSAIRLFQASGLVCSNQDCACKMPWLDYSVGIRCSKVPVGDKGNKSYTNNCTGSLSPLLDAPNPEKPSLGLLIYVKSRSWSCNKCRRNEKYTSIHKLLKEIVDKIKDQVDEYCECPKAEKYLDIHNQLCNYLGDQHWLNWKFAEATLSCWSKLVGYGGDMLKSVIASGGAVVDIPIVQQKADIYGQTIWPSVLAPTSTIYPVTLHEIERRYGRLSTYRGYYVYDAFFVNFILFAEDFKSKLRNLLTSPLKLKEDISDGIRCFQNFVQMLEVASLSLGMNEYVGEENKQLAQSASDLLALFQEVYLNVSRYKGSLILYVKDFLQSYAMHDTPFVTGVLGKFTPMGDELDDLFDVKGPDPKYRYFDLTFGSLTTTTNAPGKNSSSKSSFDSGIDDFFSKAKKSEDPTNKPASSSKGAFGFNKKDTGEQQSKIPKPFRSSNFNMKTDQTNKTKPRSSNSYTKSNSSYQGAAGAASANYNDPEYSSEDDETEYLSTEYLMKLAGMTLSDDSDEEEIDLVSLKNKIDYCEYLLSESIKDSHLTEQILNDMYSEMNDM